MVVSEADNNRYIQTLSFDELDEIRKAEIGSKTLINVRKWLLIGQRGGGFT
ncbi:MAG: hypothetical protein ACI7YS_04300 [Flavobacterium sp.]